MRDIVLTAFVFGSIPFIFRKPYIGVLMYVWLSVMNPHRLTWSFAHDFSFAAVIAVVTLISTLLSKDLRPPPLNALTIALFLFVVWTGVTTATSFYPAGAFTLWVNLIKTQVMVFLIPILFRRLDHVRYLIWVIVLSIAYYGTKGGLFILLTGGGNRVYGPEGSYIEDNNALAVAIVMIIPLMRYLQLTSPLKYVRWGLTAMMLLCGVAVIGSYSRGALLAVTAMLAFFWWKGRHKLQVLLVALVAVPLVLAFMPEIWYQRMDTIQNYEADSSANMRLNAWQTMFNVARDRPIVGAGFEGGSVDVYERYSPDPEFPPQTAHSIYFQAMGEHGFVGLGFYLLLFAMFWRQAGSLVRVTRGRPDFAWAYDFGLMMQVSIVGFMVGGAFLSLVNFDVPYYLIGATVAMRLLLDQALRAAADAINLPQAATPVLALRTDPTLKPGSR